MFKNNIKSIKTVLYVAFIALTVFLSSLTRQPAIQPKNIQFKKHSINSSFVSEGAAVGDVNHDGITDILAGNYWFQAPNWQKHLIHTDTADPVPQYCTSFLNFSMDINEDGWVDLIRFDQPGGICVWYLNPKNKNIKWTSDTILLHAGIEAPLLVDVDRDGKNDLICNDSKLKKVIWLKASVSKTDVTWHQNIISSDSVLATNKYTHGLGWGDMNKDGRPDIIITKGWWEQPLNPLQNNWTFHQASLGDDCANMYCLDVDNDGDKDVISSSAHDYGIWWYEQLADPSNALQWQKRTISNLFSQSHSLALRDINLDGHPDLITGKRWRAHNDNDPGAAEPAVLYWYEFIPGSSPRWIPHLIDNNSGVGLSFVVEDITNDQLPDIIISNKKGVYLFEQLK